MSRTNTTPGKLPIETRRWPPPRCPISRGNGHGRRPWGASHRVQHATPTARPCSPRFRWWALHPRRGRTQGRTTPAKKPGQSVCRHRPGQLAQARGIDTLSIVGYMTHNCDAATLPSAHAGLRWNFGGRERIAASTRTRPAMASAEEIHLVVQRGVSFEFSAVATTANWVAAVKNGVALEWTISSCQPARSLDLHVHDVVVCGDQLVTDLDRRLEVDARLRM